MPITLQYEGRGSMCRTFSTTLAVSLLATAWAWPASAAAPEGERKAGEATGGATAVFAGGCFWCVEQAFDEVEGVVETISGYTGGRVPNPTYEQVAGGGTDHYEALKVVYDPAEVDYRRLLETFWHNVDPTDAGGQFCDRGPQYRSAVFVADREQRRLAEKSKAKLQKDPDAPSPIVTEILAAQTFYPAEDYHQNYYRKNPLRYHFYKNACGRKQRLEQLWGETDKS